MIRSFRMNRTVRSIRRMIWWRESANNIEGSNRLSQSKCLAFSNKMSKKQVVLVTFQRTSSSIKPADPHRRMQHPLKTISTSPKTPWRRLTALVVSTWFRPILVARRMNTLMRRMDDWSRSTGVRFMTRSPLWRVRGWSRRLPCVKSRKSQEKWRKF